MKEIATISFKDAESSEEVMAIVRGVESHVALCLSSKSNGDVEAIMTKADARKLVEALEKAIEQS